MVSREVRITNATGLDLAPAGVLCDEAMRFKSKITFTTGDSYEANAKSVLSVLGACVKPGQALTLICEGEDEEQALEHMVQAIADGLGE